MNYNPEVILGKSETPNAAGHGTLRVLFDYVVHLADNALILGQRNSEWTGHGPVLEQDIAISNISLDLIGQARLLYQYAAEIQNRIHEHDGRPQISNEDNLAFLRDVHEFKNCLLCELNRGDWALTTLRQFFFSTYQYYFFQQLQSSTDTRLAAIAEKCLKEVTYHLRWSSEWVIRLGDGTEESHLRIKAAVRDLWSYTGELISPAPYETTLLAAGVSIDPATLAMSWLEKTKQIFDEATISVPGDKWMHTGGKTGVHTEHLGYLLAEMQFLQRSHPGLQW